MTLPTISKNSIELVIENVSGQWVFILNYVNDSKELFKFVVAPFKQF
jgi:hypothetical protein